MYKNVVLLWLNLQATFCLLACLHFAQAHVHFVPKGHTCTTYEVRSKCEAQVVEDGLIRHFEKALDLFLVIVKFGDLMIISVEEVEYSRICVSLISFLGNKGYAKYHR